ncbi:MAG: hypothetical protein WCF60_10895 [Anaerobacillus sp.]
MWKTLNKPWSWIMAGVLLLTFSTRARKVSRKAIVKGAEAMMELTEEVKEVASNMNKGEWRIGKSSEGKEGGKYPGYIGSRSSKGLSERVSKTTNVRRVNPTRFQNAKNVMNDEIMPYHMAEIAEEFDLFDD